MIRRLRSAIIAASLLMLLAGATELLAQGPTGASPTDGLAPSCSFQPLAAGASAWIKVPYTSDYRLQFTIDSGGAGGVNFGVYSSDTAASPVGIGTRNPNEPAHDLNWEGRLQANGYFYVKVTNTNAFAVSYRFCVTVKDPFYPPPSVDPCIIPVFAAPFLGNAPESQRNFFVCVSPI
jgi:hypothetical protein